MKIIFYSTDSTVEKFFSSLEVDNCTLISTEEEIEIELSSSEHSLIFLDFDCAGLNCSKLATELNAVDNVNTILVSGKLSLKEILDLQDTASACDAYLTKPLSVEILTGVINDFEIALSTADDNSETNGDGAENIELTFVGVKKDLLEQLANTEVEQEADEAEEDVDFNASPMQVASEVRDVIDSHKSSGTSFENVVNDEIQRKFDAVFDRSQEVQSNENEDFNITPQGFSGSEDEVENKSTISFDLESGEADSIDQNKKEIEDEAKAKASLEEVEMSKKNDSDNGLEFKIPEETSTDVVESENEESDARLSSAEIASDNDASGLEFKIGSKEESVEDTGTATATAPQSSGDLDFSDDTSEGFDLSGVEAGPVDSSVNEQEDDGLSFDDDEDVDLSLGEESEEVENISTDDSLSFDEEEDELDLNETYEGDTASLEANTPDELDFDDKIEDEGISFDEVEATDSSFEMGSDTSSDIESTISSIVAPDNSDENSTGEFDLSSTPLDETEDEPMQEFDYKTSSGFSPLEDDEFGDVDSSVGDNTNPTVVASTASISSALFDLSNEEKEEDEYDLDDISFGDSDSKSEEESLSDNEFAGDFEVTETVHSDFKIDEDKEASLVAKKSVGHEDLSRNYDEDELLRLQGTIRQLREERESLMENINVLTSEKQLISQDNLGLKAELDEIKIELEIVKKRSHDEISEMKYQMNLSHEKKDVYEMKYKTLYKEFDRLNQKVRIDFNQVKQREKELESKLELVVMDSDSQVQTRDMKILELKRKIDSLEFNMENTSIREQKHREDKSKLEERLAKIMKTLRGSIQLIEDDLEVLETDNTTELDKT